MTREEAVSNLKLFREIYEPPKDFADALDMAIDALSQPIVCKDYRIDDDHIYCSPKMADRVVETLSERPKGEWVFHVSFSDESQRDDYDLICTNCGELYRCDCQDAVNDFVWNAHYCMNCGAYMGGDNGKQKHL